MPLDGSVGASCADVSESSIRWRINEGCVFFKLVEEEEAGGGGGGAER